MVNNEEVLVVRRERRARKTRHAQPGPSLSDWRRTSPASLTSKTVPLASGDVMVLFTDGVTEAMNGGGAAYGIERLSEAVRLNHKKSAGSIREAVLRNLAEYTGGLAQLDDVSLLVVKPG